MRDSASFLIELLLAGDNMLSLNPIKFSAARLSQIIEYV
jgi:hypothetical protein